ncbi:hypothetical protein JOC54_002226 [Alkalihalobacillus xiaoxiensis]|uniref:Uncharacterized protein n=1 Tax=Shouchella xiaoxiensis TaxID=766895 RepID=A0ABS2STX6_9BACI|nr:hypothetical protein [Shouchella xiaoxiensis]MBM7838956.1 hypothetical protein [Shouchella xiaoxiensis]
MTNKKTLVFSLGTLVGSCLLFITIGSFVIASQDKVPAFTGEYDVNAKEELLVVTEYEGSETLSLVSNNEKAISLFESEVDAYIFSPIYTNDHTAVFIQTTGYDYGDYIDETTSEFAYSTIQSIDLSTNEVTIIAEARGVLFDLVYIPTSDQLVVSGENITQGTEPQPVGRAETKLFNVNDSELEVIYEGSPVLPSSIQATNDGQLMMILPDDQGSWTVDSMYESIERVFSANPTENPLNLELVSNPDKIEPITSFAQIEDGLIYQTIFNYQESDAIYDYDLIPYSYNNKKEGTRLGISGHEIEALLYPKKDVLYYVKRTDAYRNGNDFSLHRHDLRSGTGIEINLLPQTDE